MCPLMIALHPSGRMELFLSAGADEEHPVLLALQDDLAEELVRLREKVQQVCSQAAPRMASADEASPKRGRPAGAATGLDLADQRQKLDDAERLRREEHFTWRAIALRLGISEDTLARWRRLRKQGRL